MKNKELNICLVSLAREIKIIKEGGKILSAILKRLAKEVKPGVSTEYLDSLAEKLIKDAGGRPAFKNYDMGGGVFFPSTICASINASTLPSNTNSTDSVIFLVSIICIVGYFSLIFGIVP